MVPCSELSGPPRAHLPREGGPDLGEGWTGVRGQGHLQVSGLAGARIWPPVAERGSSSSLCLSPGSYWRWRVALATCWGGEAWRRGTASPSTCPRALWQWRPCWRALVSARRTVWCLQASVWRPWQSESETVRRRHTVFWPRWWHFMTFLIVINMEISTGSGSL